MFVSQRNIIVVFILSIILLAGCSDDKISSPPTVLPSVSINPGPDDISVPWTLSLEDTFFAGIGDTVFSQMQPGNFVIHWGELAGWYSLESVTDSAVVEYGQDVEFTRLYSELLSITIDVEPDTYSWEWVLTGPSGLEMSGNGNAILHSCLAGNYSLRWVDRPGYASPDPNPEVFQLTCGESVTIAGTYLELSGIDIQHTPVQVPAAFTLNGPRGYTISGSSPMELTDLVPGSYQIEWSEYEGWESPDASLNEFELEPSTQFLIEGLYSWPKLIGINSEYEIYDLIIFEGFLVAAAEGLIVSYDISDPTNPEVVHALNLDIEYPYDIRFNPFGEYLLITSHDTLRAVSIGPDGVVTLVSDTVFPDFSPVQGVVRGSYLYVADFGRMLSIINLQDIHNPHLLPQIADDWFSAGCAVRGDFAYLTHGDAYEGNPWNLVIVDISDPENPEQVGEIEVNAYQGDTHIIGDLLYVIGYPSTVYSLADPLVPSAIYDLDYNCYSWYSRIASEDDRLVLYSNSGEDGHSFQVMDISVPETPVFVAKKGGGYYGIVLEESYLYAGTGGGLSVFQLSNEPGNRQ